MPREAKNFDHLIGKAKGLSETQLKAHFTLYQGYVKKLNEILEKKGSTDKGAVNYSHGDYSELLRREPVAFNGTVLHELYFENLGDGSTAPGDATKRLITEGFGSFDNWLADTKAAMASAHGWTVLAWDPAQRKLLNNLIQSEHHVGLFANVQIVCAIDAWEHAYFFDYQTAKAKYVEAVLSGLDWSAIEGRLKGLGAL